MCMHSLQVVVLLCTLLCRVVEQLLYFKPRMSESCIDVAGTSKKCQVIMMILMSNMRSLLVKIWWN